MSRILFLVATLLLSLTAYSQKIRFTDTSNKWIVAVHKTDGVRYHTVGTNYRYRQDYTGDTVLQGVHYLKLTRKFSYDGHTDMVLVREDTVLRKVYMCLGDVSKERVLFDYNAKVGDTLFVYLSEHDLDTFIVKSAATKTINNEPHTSLELNGISQYGYEHMTIVEGWGYHFGARWPGDVIGTYDGAGLGRADQRLPICFEHKGSTAGFYSAGNRVDCQWAPTEIEQIDTKPAVLKVYPQPAHDKVTIELPSAISNGELTIVNSMGQIIYKKTIDKQNHLVINNNFPQGLYYYRITDDATNNIYSGKLIFAD
jgi:hypothetical protein